MFGGAIPSLSAARFSLPRRHPTTANTAIRERPADGPYSRKSAYQNIYATRLTPAVSSRLEVIAEPYQGHTVGFTVRGVPNQLRRIC